MNAWFITFVSLSLSGSVVALLLVLFKLIFKNKLSKTWGYYIWLVVILRLIIPFSPEISFVGELFNSTESHIAMSNTSDGATYDTNSNPIQQLPIGEVLKPIEPVTPIATFNLYKIVTDALWVVWLAVAIAMLMWKIIGYNNFISYVKFGSKKVDNNEMLEVYHNVCISMNIKKSIPLYVNDFSTSPMLVGVLNQFIVLPKIDISDKDLQYILQHELTHYKRLDIYYKWLVQVAVCLHWFNPLAYWVSREINKSCELSCDENIIKQLDEHSKYDYGETLISVIKPNTAHKKKIISLSLNEDTKLIKERLGEIMKFKRKTKIAMMIAIILTVTVITSATILGAYTVDKTSNTQLYPKTPQTSSTLVIVENSIKIDTQSLTNGGKISIGNNTLPAETKGNALISWKGDGNLSITCTSETGESSVYVISNNKAMSFTIEKAGEYSIDVKNEGQNATNLKGQIWFGDAKQIASSNSNKPKSSNAQTIVFEKVEMRKYDSGHPREYIHEVKTNNTDRKIVGNKCGMLAFDKDGKPLEIYWNGLDSSVDKSYSFLYDWAKEEITAHTTYDVRGGWSLNERGDEKNVAKIVYVLYCDKEITFEDGTIWKNPDYDKWITTYEGKTVAVETLKNYYPYAMKID